MVFWVVFIPTLLGLFLHFFVSDVTSSLIGLVNKVKFSIMACSVWQYINNSLTAGGFLRFAWFQTSLQLVFLGKDMHLSLYSAIMIKNSVLLMSESIFDDIWYEGVALRYFHW